MTARLPIPRGVVPLDMRDRPAWMAGIDRARPGVIFEDESSGERLRVGPRGELEPVLPGGRPGGICAHATAAKR